MYLMQKIIEILLILWKVKVILIQLIEDTTHSLKLILMTDGTPSIRNVELPQVLSNNEWATWSNSENSASGSPSSSSGSSTVVNEQDIAEAA